MFRMVIAPLIIGILVFSLVYFASPLMLAESETVARFAKITLDLSNACFVTTPSLFAGYIANLNLLIVAVTVGLVTTLVIQMLVLIGTGFVRLIHLIPVLLRRRAKENPAPDLPPIEFESKFKGPEKDRIFGSGFDSIDRT